MERFPSFGLMKGLSLRVEGIFQVPFKAEGSSSCTTINVRRIQLEPVHNISIEQKAAPDKKASVIWQFVSERIEGRNYLFLLPSLLALSSERISRILRFVRFILDFSKENSSFSISASRSFFIASLTSDFQLSTRAFKREHQSSQLSEILVAWRAM